MYHPNSTRSKELSFSEYMVHKSAEKEERSKSPDNSKSFDDRLKIGGTKVSKFDIPSESEQSVTDKIPQRA